MCSNLSKNRGIYEDHYVSHSEDNIDERKVHTNKEVVVAAEEELTATAAIKKR